MCNVLICFGRGAAAPGGGITRKQEQSSLRHPCHPLAHFRQSRSFVKLCAERARTALYELCRSLSLFPPSFFASGFFWRLFGRQLASIGLSPLRFTNLALYVTQPSPFPLSTGCVFSVHYSRIIIVAFAHPSPLFSPLRQHGHERDGEKGSIDPGEADIVRRCYNGCARRQSESAALQRRCHDRASQSINLD